MSRLEEEIKRRVSEELLLERKDPTTGLEVCVALLNTLTGKDFSHYLNTHTQIDKNGKSSRVHDYCLHHISGNHESRDINDLCIILVSDHNAHHSKKNYKPLEDCDHIKMKDYLQKFLKDIADEIKD